ncbi:sugar kinase [Leucobacter japonicus]|uniref:sugar kinase n=1 Tax=Leucobacter japonicus TaxID=1461259 RepID=UPI000B2364B0|nr:sugar kinase [Leucobacter japonicus]
MTAAVAEQPYVLTLGESMGLVRQAGVGRLATQRAVELGFGGAESNVAIGVRRLGIDAVWCGRLGADSLGDLIERELRAEGVRADVIRDPESPTGLMLKEHPAAGSTRVVYYRRASAGSRLAPDDLPDGLVEGAALLHVTGITPALSPSADAAVEAAMRRARAAGVPVSIDLNYRSALWSPEQAGARLRELVALADVVFAGDDEAELVVGGGSTAELAARLGVLGPTEAVIKLGADGCVALVDGARFEVAAVPVDVVDTVGAGDAFVAGYLAERVRGLSPEARLRTAVAAGASACLAPGDWEGLPTRDDLRRLSGAGGGDPVQR